MVDEPFGDTIPSQQPNTSFKKRKHVAVHNSANVFQQWEFNDLTQPSQPTPPPHVPDKYHNPEPDTLPPAALSPPERRSKRKKTARTNYVFFVEPPPPRPSHPIEKQKSSKTPKKKQKKGKPKKVVAKPKKPKMASTKKKRKRQRKKDEEGISEDDEPAEKRRNYGKIKITLTRPIHSIPYRSLPRAFTEHNSRQKRRKIAPPAPVGNPEDPFAFLSILDRIEFISPEDACQKVSGEFDRAEKELSRLDQKWSHWPEKFAGVANSGQDEPIISGDGQDGIGEGDNTPSGEEGELPVIIL
eukprot:sb/3467392/